MLKKLTILFAFALMLAFAAQSAMAVTQVFTITNNSGASRSDLHLVFTGTGGTANLAITDNNNAPGCSKPMVANPGSPWDITWSTTCVDNAEVVTVVITSDSPVAFSSGYWTPGNVALSPIDVDEVFGTIPTLSTWGLILLALVLVAAGVFMARRKISLQGA